ncbi:peptidylprolyl isomerase [Sphingomonas psychrolutea]|uniref:Parvulin-like PPIase n=1 Tax=Sphingomonas psychrolutea TaxID=1259676 RepID=A0ABQ1H6N5_9SPHN|nr:peptidylprolyl isomerase [Sphingomonas psychrolutea]GGA59651.1 rotamase [Sphingomonas psychrolutea]
MISFIRRFITNPIGAAIALGFVALMGLIFVLSDRAGLSGSGSSAAQGDVAVTVGNKTITVAELRAAAQRDVDQYRQQNPQLDMAGFVAGGGFEATVERMIDSAAFRAYAKQQGMIISKKSVDGIIASQPGLAGIDGKFDPKKYEAALQQIGSTDAQVRDDLTDQIVTRHLIIPTVGATQVPVQLALPYSSLLLEQRRGVIGFIPTQAVPAGPAPTDAELTIYYARNVSRYRVPERRILRYALVNPATVAAQITPTEAEIAAAYKAQSAKYAPADLRTIVQVVLADQAAATALAAKVRSGTPIEAAARAAGLEPITATDVQKAAYVTQSSVEIANAAFAGKVGDVVGPLRAPLGFVVLKIEKQRTQAAKTLAEATPELKAALLTQKTGTVLGKLRASFDDALARDHFDGLVAKNKLTALRTPALLANGVDPDAPTAKPDPALAQIVAAGFAAQAGDEAQTIPLGTDGSFALAQLDKIVAAAPRPLAQIRDIVARDFTIERSQRAARQVAATVVAAASKGTPLAQALGATGLKLPPLRPIAGPRAQLLANPRAVPPPLALLFAMAQNTTKLLEAPENAGFFIIHLDTIVPGDARGNGKVIAGTRSDIGKVIGREYAAQFGKAVQRAVGVKRNAAAIAKLKADLLGGASATDQP